MLDLAVNKEKTFGAYGAPWQFNLRDLMRFAQGLEHDKELIGRFLRLIFIERFRSEADRAAALTLIKSVFSDVTLEFKNDAIEISDEAIKFGCVQMARSKTLKNGQANQENLLVTLDNYAILQSLALCVQNNWLSILVGDGKTQDLTANIQLLAGLTGQTLHCLTLSSATDTSELLGGFEQTSQDLILSTLRMEILEKMEQDFDPLDKDVIQLKLRLKQETQLSKFKEHLK